jgi:hypothetical protein
MATLLRDAQIPGLNVLLKVFTDEGHLTVWPGAFMHGIRAVFSVEPWHGDRQVDDKP